jgi:hypothetical protein
MLAAPVSRAAQRSSPIAKLPASGWLRGDVTRSEGLSGTPGDRGEDSLVYWPASRQPIHRFSSACSHTGRQNWNETARSPGGPKR